MTNNELIKELVTYDGYKDIGYNTFINDVDNGYLFTIPELNEYLTDMNILHRLAVKVFGEVVDSELDVSDINDLCFNVRNAIMYSPNPQGEHLQLAEALVNAIKYIQNEPKG